MAVKRTKSSRKKATRGGTTGKRKRATPKVTSTGQRNVKARKSGASTKKKVTINSTVRKHLQGFLDPFANLSGAKIPDGGTIKSLPLTHRVVKEITSTPNPGQGQGQAPGDGTIHIALYPGMTTGLYYQEDLAGDNTEPDNHFTYATDGWLTLDNGPTQDNIGEDGSGTAKDTIIGTGGGISRWRVVSQALKLSLLNTDHENDGWWESARVTYKPDMDHWKLISPANNHNFGASWTTVGEKMYLGANDNLINYMELRNLAEAKSYKCGSLKDIHRMQWNLMPFSKDNEFMELQERYLFTPDEFLPTTAEANTVDQLIPLKSGGVAAKKLYESLIDNNHDMVIIRIHPGVSGTKLLADLAVNQEVVYDIDSTLAKHMTECEVDVASFEKAREVKHATNQSSAVMIE